MTRFPITLTVVLAIAALEIIFKRFPHRDISEQDTLLDMAYFFQSAFVVGPLVAFGLAALQTYLLPQYADRFIDAPIWLQVVCFLIFDDLVQYWFHRWVHNSPRLWPMHLPHHSATYMGIRMVHRNGFFYVLLFPSVWLSGLMVYLGFGAVYVGYSVVKAIVTQMAHSELRWDARLYRHWPRVAWCVERIISTPATHFAHHAAAQGDGVGHHNGNYGNLLFLWDVIFGTALISRRYPERIGLPADALQPRTWYQLMLYPLFRR